MHRPVVIRFVMASPVILTDGASLDALLAYLVFAEGQDGVGLLDSLFARKGRVHSCSWLYAEQGHVVGNAKLTRLQRTGAALNARNLAPPRGSERFRVDNKRGEAVNILTTFTSISTPSVWAFATGDPMLLSRHLSGLTGIGLKRGNGFGRVQQVEIGTVRGWAEFGRVMPDGAPARAIPEEEWRNDAKRGAYALGFPRWSSMPEKCVIPAQRTIAPSIFGDMELLALSQPS